MATQCVGDWYLITRWFLVWILVLDWIPVECNVQVLTVACNCLSFFRSSTLSFSLTAPCRSRFWSRDGGITSQNLRTIPARSSPGWTGSTWPQTAACLTCRTTGRWRLQTQSTVCSFPGRYHTSTHISVLFNLILLTVGRNGWGKPEVDESIDTNTDVCRNQNGADRFCIRWPPRCSALWSISSRAFMCPPSDKDDNCVWLHHPSWERLYMWAGGVESELLRQSVVLFWETSPERSHMLL